jgi:uncharacterized protein
MKRIALYAAILALAGLAPAAFAYVSPGSPRGYVSDFAEIISPDVEASISAKLSTYQAATGNEIAVVTVASLDGEAIEPYATELFEEWGIGKEKEDNGALLLVAPNDREARIEVGYGLEPYLTDAASSRIMRETLLPAFREGQYEAGIAAGVDRMLAGLTGAEDLTDERTDSAGFGLSQDLLIFLVIVLAQLVPVIIYSKSWWLGGVVGAALGFIAFSSFPVAIGLGLFGLVADYLLSKRFGGKGPKGGGGMPGVWFGGLGGGSRGGGGFGGFGGGMSGGGGSSGRW